MDFIAIALLFMASEPDCADPHSTYGMVLRERGVPICEGPKVPVPQQTATTISQQRAVKTYFDKILFDGNSARWKFTGKWKDGSICGSVNAKNRFGAYVGWRVFAYRNNDGVITDDSGRLEWWDKRKFDCILPNEPLGL